jgi:hypothetical protein
VVCKAAVATELGGIQIYFISADLFVVKMSVVVHYYCIWLIVAILVHNTEVKMIKIESTKIPTPTPPV